MAFAPPKYADTNIVDRSKIKINSETLRTVRSTREKLSLKNGSGFFDRTLIKIHANNLVRGGFALPVLICFITLGCLVSGMDIRVLFWTGGALLVHGILTALAYQINQCEENEIDVERCRIYFLVCHFMTGLTWVGMVFLTTYALNGEQVMVIKAILLLLAIGLSAVIMSSLNGALMATFIFPIIIYVFLITSAFDTLQAMLAILLVVALFFFTYISRHLYNTTVMLLSFRSEKDGLIAELETEKSVSDEARRRAEESNLAKSRFLASMSHELRTPLNAINGFAEIMATEMMGPLHNETYKSYAKDIHTSGEHLLGLINEILDLSRIEAGRYELNEERFSLTEVADKCCKMLEVKLREKDIILTKQFEHDFPEIFADIRSVRQVLLNLLSNAIKFTPTGTQIVVKVGWTSTGGQYIAVRDYGPGIAAEEIPIVLSAFGQGSIAIKSAEQGTGLGLPIVQAIMTMHGGRFDLKSKLREGTEVMATFPASRVMAHMPALPTDGRNAKRSTSGFRKQAAS